MTPLHDKQQRPPHSAARQGTTAGSQSATPWLLAGMFFVALYITQAIAGWNLGWLAALQEIELYKQFTGLALTLLFLMQWRLTLSRMEGATQNATRRLVTHRHWGAAAPLLLLIHANGFGYAYIRVLCFAFLGLISLGLLHQLVSRFKQPWVMTSWIVVHVALAAMLICLIGYHGFNSFYYS